MSVNRKKYQNVLQDNNHVTVVSRGNNGRGQLANQAQDAFSVERIPPQYFMQRMGQLQIFATGRGRYNLKNYQNQESLTFPAETKRFPTSLEQQESFVILPKKKKNFVVQVPNFFRIYPRVKKFVANPERSESVSYIQNTRPDFEKKNEHNFLIERRKRLDNLIESTVNNINLKSEGKFFYNKPTLKKKTTLEIEYLVIKAPFKLENATEVFLEPKPQKKDHEKEQFEIFYDMKKQKGFPLGATNISDNMNMILHKKPSKSLFKKFEIVNSDKVELIHESKPSSYSYLTIEDMPDIFIEERPGKRYVSVGMENLTFPGSLRPEFCLEIEPNEDIFVPNVYDMLLIQNFWDNLEVNSFRICFRPFGYVSNKNLIKEPDIENKENINENKENNKEGQEKEGIKDEDKKEGENNIDNKEGNDTSKKQESKGDEAKKKKMSLLKNVFGFKKGS